MGIQFNTTGFDPEVDLYPCYIGSSSQSGCPLASSQCSGGAGYGVYSYDPSGPSLDKEGSESACGSGAACPTTIAVSDPDKGLLDLIHSYNPYMRYFVCCEASSSSGAMLTINIDPSTLDLGMLVQALGPNSTVSITSAPAPAAPAPPQASAKPASRNRPAAKKKATKKKATKKKATKKKSPRKKAPPKRKAGKKRK